MGSAVRLLGFPSATWGKFTFRTSVVVVVLLCFVSVSKIRLTLISELFLGEISSALCLVRTNSADGS